MENTEQKLKQLKNIRMTETEKSVMGQFLRGYMAQHRPLLRPSPYMAHFHIFGRLAALSLIAVILGGGGISAAAAKALPGEKLYQVKIHVNEEVKGFFAVTPKQKLVFQEARLEERFKEIRFLAQTPSENTEAPKELAQAIQKQTDDIKKTIDEIQEQNSGSVVENKEDSVVAIETSQKVTESLEVHEVLLSQAQTGEDAGSEELASILLPTLSDAKEALAVEIPIPEIGTVEISTEEKPIDTTENTKEESDNKNPSTEEKPIENTDETSLSNSTESVNQVDSLSTPQETTVSVEAITEISSIELSKEVATEGKIEEVKPATEQVLTKVVGFIKRGCGTKACKTAPYMENISVSILNTETMSVVHSVLPDATGYVTSSLPIGNYMLQVIENGNIIIEKPVSVDGKNAVTVTLEESPLIRVNQIIQ